MVLIPLLLPDEEGDLGPLVPQPYCQAMTLRALLSLLTVLLLNPPALVQTAAQDVDGARLPAVELPVNFERVKRQLAALPATDDERSILKLNFYVEVYGRAPRLDLLRGFDRHNGPVPFGGPSHADMRALWTPEEFSAPVANLGSALDWLVKR